MKNNLLPSSLILSLWESLRVTSITILIFLISTYNLFPQDNHSQNKIKLSDVPIHIEGDGLHGTVDLRVRAACVDHSIQVAVDKILVTGVTIGGNYYTGVDIEGYHFPEEVPVKGNVYLRGSVRISDSKGNPRLYQIKPGSIGASLSGFLDWVSLQKSSEPSWIKTCPEWKDFFNNGITGHELKIYKEDMLGDGFFWKLKGIVQKMDENKALLSKLENDYQQAESVYEFKEIINKVDRNKWIQTYEGEAEELKSRAKDALEEIKEENNKQAAEEAKKGDEEEDSKENNLDVEPEKNGKDKIAPLKIDKDKKKAQDSPEAKELRDLEIENQIKFENNMSIAKEYESTGNTRKALEFYERANQFKSSPELNAKLTYHRRLVGAQNVSRSIASLFIKDSDKELAKWRADINARNEREQREIDRFNNTLFDRSKEISIYSLNAYFNLTGNEKYLTEPSLLPSIIEMKNKQLQNSIDKVLTKEIAKPIQERSDHLYFFAFFPNARNYRAPQNVLNENDANVEVMNASRSLKISKMRSNSYVSGDIITEEQLIQQLGKYPYLEASYSSILSIPVDVLKKLNEEKVDYYGTSLHDLHDKILYLTSICKYMMGSYKNKPLIIASSSREEIKYLKQQLVNPSINSSAIHLKSSRYYEVNEDYNWFYEALSPF